MASFLIVIRRLFFVFVFLFITLNFISRGERFSRYHEDPWFYRPFLMAASPFQKGYSFVTKGTSAAVTHYLYLVGVWEENQIFKTENAQLKEQMLLWRALKSENDRLRELFHFDKTLTWETLPAQVIAYDPMAMTRLITINRGSREGIKRRQPVISPDGLVGQVYRVESHLAQVLLISDPSSTVDVVGEKSRVRGLIKGALSQLDLERSLSFMSRLEYIEKDAAVPPNELMMTSGLDQVYPKGIPVGTIETLTSGAEDIFQQGNIVPKADLTRLEEVLVLIKY